MSNLLYNIYWITRDFYESVNDGKVMTFFRENFSESVKACCLYQDRTPELSSMGEINELETSLLGKGMVP